MNDLYRALRQFARQPRLALVVVLLLTVGIGVNTVVFSWVSGLLLRPLRGVEQAERIVALTSIAADGNYIDSSYPDFLDYRAQARSLAGLAAFQDRPLSFGPDDGAQRVWAELVSGNFFDVLGLRPVAGRFFDAAEQEEAPNTHPVVVLSERFWERMFHRDPGILGSTVHLNRQEFTVIGIAPGEFQGGTVGLAFDLFVPVLMQQTLTGAGPWTERRSARPLKLLARLAPNVSIESARTEIAGLATRLGQTYPDSNARVRATLLPISQAPYGAQSRLGTLLYVLLGAGGVVLLIVTTNVSNLLLARGFSRRREFEIRRALGASQRDLVRQLTIEGLTLALLGGGGGVAMAYSATSLLGVFVPPTELPLHLQFGIDAGVLGFTLALSCGIGLIAGWIPALQFAGGSQAAMLREGGRSQTMSRRSRRVQHVLVVTQVALALVALVGAALFLDGLQRARRTDPGFRPDHVLLAGLILSEYGYDREHGRDFLRRAQERIEALPGVTVASFAEDVPLGLDGGSWQTVAIDGYTPGRDENMNVLRNPVAPRYFELMRIPLIEGREFSDRDNADFAPVMIVNETFAQRYFADRAPIGRHVQAAGRDWTVVGVARDIKYEALDEAARPYFYLPLAQSYEANLGLALHVRTETDATVMFNAVRHTLQALDPRIQLFETLTLADYISASWFSQKLLAVLLTSFGGLALALAAVGLFGVMAFVVGQRTREIGIRMALGARTADVLRAVLGEGLRLALIGMVFGALAALALVPIVATRFRNISAVNPLIAGTLAAVLLVVIAVACYLPAHRAARLDPLRALREE